MKEHVPKEHTLSLNALIYRDHVAEEKRLRERQKRRAKREAERAAQQPDVIKDDRCSVCLKMTRNFSARINLTRDDGGLIAIGICAKCVNNGYTFDKGANIIHKFTDAS